MSAASAIGVRTSGGDPPRRRLPRRGNRNAARAWRRFRQNRLALVALVLAGLLVLLAAGAPLVSAHVTGVGPNDQSLIHRFRPRGDGHWLGTDEYGRDVLTRLVYGLRVSLGVAGLATLVTVLLGTAVGAIAAYYGGLVDQALMRAVDVFMAIPGINLLILLGSLFTIGPVKMAILIALIGWFQLARLVRGEVLAVRRREFVEAARVMGAPNRRIIVQHVLPNVVHIVIVFATLAIPAFVLTEAGMSFIGLGIKAPTPSLGNMLNGATTYLYKRPVLIVYPGAIITLIALVVSVIGNALRDALDPRLNA